MILELIYGFVSFIIIGAWKLIGKIFKFMGEQVKMVEYVIRFDMTNQKKINNFFKARKREKLLNNEVI